MPIIFQLLLGLVVVGVLLYLFNTLVTVIDPRIKTVINALVFLMLFVWLLYCLDGFFMWGWFSSVGPAGAHGYVNGRCR